MGITTKTGDDGKSRWMGRTVEKDSDLLESIGTIDELMAGLEMVEKKNEFRKIKLDLWRIMGELSCGQEFEDCSLRVGEMEEEVKDLERTLCEVNNFMGFNNSQAKAINWVRTVARRAERRLVKLSRSQNINPKILVYFNRLSDYLFICGRKAEES